MTEKAYITIAGGYSYSPMKAGVVLRAPNGQEVYFQPGDGAAALYESIDALDEIPDDKRAVIADMAFGDYFA